MSRFSRQACTLAWPLKKPAFSAKHLTSKELKPTFDARPRKKSYRPTFYFLLHCRAKRSIPDISAKRLDDAHLRFNGIGVMSATVKESRQETAN